MFQEIFLNDGFANVLSVGIPLIVVIFAMLLVIHFMGEAIKVIFSSRIVQLLSLVGIIFFLIKVW
ncbi:hypothetical protein [Metasolibacillus sp.]|uniref:hypothetical protein n=1 Tax=Metasolibacillus sp. TaxID=2703680 RepID=UPI0025DAFA86|nr:hypothetical protein [Metasolibacillus sp.]MCT6926347.1 hypothetical protein [Metasolibacillus sp.]MCT6942608.1 hypothetical protein [Metasolibacillus sp.]